jgi:hypothetical protein
MAARLTVTVAHRHRLAADRKFNRAAKTPAFMLAHGISPEG